MRGRLHKAASHTLWLDMALTIAASLPLVYLVTHIVTFRAIQFVRSKARFAGNVGDISKNRNAAAGEVGGSLRASRQGPPTALRFLDVAPL